MNIFSSAILAAAWISVAVAPASAIAAEIRIGLIGLDTSHVIKLAETFNDPASPEHIPGARIVCAYKGGSPDLEMSRSRIEGFTTQLREKYRIPIFGSIAELIAGCDAVMLESVDGRVHLAQAREVLQSRKPLFIDKPFAGSLRDAVKLVRLAEEMQAPVFSSSGLRFASGTRQLQAAKVGRIRGVIVHGPLPIEPTVPDLYFYGIHSTEALFTLLGPGCVSVVRTHTDDTDVVTGRWRDGRTGIVYGLRNGKAPYGVTVYGANAIASKTEGDDFRDRFPAVVRAALEFFRTGKSPVPLDETLEIMAFMEAADESKRQGGVPVEIDAVLMSAGWVRR